VQGTYNIANANSGGSDSMIVEGLFTSIRLGDAEKVGSFLILIAAFRIPFDLCRATELAVASGNEEVIRQLVLYKTGLEREKTRKKPLDILKETVEELTIVNAGLRQEIDMLKVETELLQNAFSKRSKTSSLM